MKKLLMMCSVITIAMTGQAEAVHVDQQTHAQPAGINTIPSEPSMSQAELRQRHKQEIQQFHDNWQSEYDAAMAGKSSEGFDRYKVQTDFVLKRREALRDLNNKHQAELAEFRSKLHGDHPDLSQAKPPELLVDKQEKEHQQERPWSPE